MCMVFSYVRNKIGGIKILPTFPLDMVSLHVLHDAFVLLSDSTVKYIHIGLLFVGVVKVKHRMICLSVQPALPDILFIVTMSHYY